MTANLRGSLQEDNIRLGIEFSKSILPLIKSGSGFGSMFAFEPEGFSLIPQIAQLAWQRKQGLSTSDDQFCRATYVALLDSLDAESSNPRSWDETHPVISVKINVLLMYLHASFYEHDGSSEWITELLQPLIDRTMTLLTHVKESEACYGLFWSILVMGSYTRDQDKQQLLVHQLETNQSNMPLTKRGIDLLRWLWDDHNDANFGLAGLEKIATVHGVDLCIC